MQPSQRLPLDTFHSAQTADTVYGLHPAFPQYEATRALVGRRLADVERDLILDTLRFCLGNRTRAAKMLGVSIRTMRNRLKEFAADGISIPSNEGCKVRSRASRVRQRLPRLD